MPDLANEAAWKAELDALASSNAAMATLAREQVAAWLLRHRNAPDLSRVDVHRLATIAGVFTDKAAGEQGPGSETGCCEEECDLTDAPEAELDLWRVARDADGKAETVTERRLAAGRFAPAVPGTALGAGLVVPAPAVENRKPEEWSATRGAYQGGPGRLRRSRVDPSLKEPGRAPAPSAPVSLSYTGGVESETGGKPRTLFEANSHARQRDMRTGLFECDGADAPPRWRDEPWDLRDTLRHRGSRADPSRSPRSMAARPTFSESLPTCSRQTSRYRAAAKEATGTPAIGAGDWRSASRCASRSFGVRSTCVAP